MSNDLSIPSPGRFGLSSFADILPKRDPIIGEAPGSFAGFHDGMMLALTPFTPYECVIAENVIAIEWELLQHRRMRDASLRNQIQVVIRNTIISQQREAMLDADWDRHIAAGGREEDWEEPDGFDETAARERADDLAARAVSPDPDIHDSAYAELTALGRVPLDLMGAAYRDQHNAATKHDAKIEELERRRREVKRDYDALQKPRPLDGEIIDG